MSSMFCSLEEAFSGPEAPVKEKDKKKRRHAMEQTSAVAAAAAASTTTGSPSLLAPPQPNIPPPMGAPPAAITPAGGRLQATDNDAGFPLPGESADGEEWTKAFTLEPSMHAASTLAPPPWSVQGAPTLWREAAAAFPATAVHPPSQIQAAPMNMDFTQRLDRLTKQLDALTGGSNSMNGTAELFLFVAVGLILLLAIDTLLRFAVHLVGGTAAAMEKVTGKSKVMMGGRRFMRRMFR